MLVTREADYAIRCVLEVARHGRISAAQVAKIQHISPTFLGKIVQSLAKAGILATRRGVGGGVSLAIPAEEISLLRVIEAIEGPLALNDCLTNAPQCQQLAGCPAYPYLHQAQSALRQILAVSIASMLLASPPPATVTVDGEPVPEPWAASPNNGELSSQAVGGGDPR